jgi:hypothetical protein
MVEPFSGMKCARCGKVKPCLAFPLPNENNSRTPESKLVRQAMIRELVGREEIPNQVTLLKRLRENGVNINQAILSKYTKELHIGKMPYKGGYILFLPQGLLLCRACERLSEKEDPPKKAKRKQKPVKEPEVEEEQEQCPVCQKMRSKVDFQGQKYCRFCGDFFSVHLCELCNKEYQQPEMVPPERNNCIYCLLKRGSYQDILALRELVKKDEVAAVKIVEYIKTRHETLL